MREDHGASRADVAALDGDAAAALARLRGVLAPLGSVVVAFSGGVDSALVLKVAHDLFGPRALAATGRSASFAPEEMADARRIALEIGAPLRIVDTEEITLKGYAENPLDRCFFCKTELYRKLRALAQAEGAAHVVDGVNADDARGHDRPGIEAGERLGVVSPLLEAGIGKALVRTIARSLGLSVAEKPAMACLSSRIPFGEPITEAKLAQVAQAESALRRLGLASARVRHHGEIARIELPPERASEAFAPERRAAITSAVKAAGFIYVTIDLEGYRSGSMHEVLSIRPAPRRAPGVGGGAS